MSGRPAFPEISNQEVPEILERPTSTRSFRQETTKVMNLKNIFFVQIQCFPGYFSKNYKSKNDLKVNIYKYMKY